MSSTSRYWALVYCTFFGSSLLCFNVGMFMSNGTLGPALIVLVPAALAYVATAVFNLKQPSMLVDGSYSYHAAEARWLSIFRVEADPVTSRV